MRTRARARQSLPGRLPDGAGGLGVEAVRPALSSRAVEAHWIKVKNRKHPAKPGDGCAVINIPVRKFKSMAVALKTLGPYIEDATHLQTGKPFQNFGDMRSREAVANWLLCATANGIDGRILGALAD